MRQSLLSPLGGDHRAVCAIHTRISCHEGVHDAMRLLEHARMHLLRHSPDVVSMRVDVVLRV